MEPVVSNSFSNTCPDPISSNCVTSQVSLAMMPCLNLCGTVSVTQVEQAMGNLINTLVQQLSLTQEQVDALPSTAPVVSNPPIDFSALDLGCLVKPVLTCTCPSGYTYIPDPTGATNGSCSNGCGAGTFPAINPQTGEAVCQPCPINTPCPGDHPPIPVCSSITPVTPTTLLGVLQLIINKTCNCCP